MYVLLVKLSQLRAQNLIDCKYLQYNHKYEMSILHYLYK